MNSLILADLCSSGLRPYPALGSGRLCGGDQGGSRGVPARRRSRVRLVREHRVRESFQASPRHDAKIFREGRRRWRYEGGGATHHADGLQRRQGRRFPPRSVRPSVTFLILLPHSLIVGLKISEIFGPILPIVPVDDVRQAIEYINAQ